MAAEEITRRKDFQDKLRAEMGKSGLDHNSVETSFCNFMMSSTGMPKKLGIGVGYTTEDSAEESGGRPWPSLIKDTNPYKNKVLEKAPRKNLAI